MGQRGVFELEGCRNKVLGAEAHCGALRDFCHGPKQEVQNVVQPSLWGGSERIQGDVWTLGLRPNQVQAKVKHMKDRYDWFWFPLLSLALLLTIFFFSSEFLITCVVIVQRDVQSVFVKRCLREVEERQFCNGVQRELRDWIEIMQGDKLQNAESRNFM